MPFLYIVLSNLLILHFVSFLIFEEFLLSFQLSKEPSSQSKMVIKIAKYEYSFIVSLEPSPYISLAKFDISFCSFKISLYVLYMSKSFFILLLVLSSKKFSEFF